MSIGCILNFHGIGARHRALDPGESDVWLEEMAFEKILESIRLEDPVGITFDDGNLSDLEIALPHLLRLDLKAEFFISTGKIGLEGYLNASQVRDISQAGMRVGSHGISHRSWRTFDDPGLLDEVESSRSELEEILNGPVEHAACPLGAYDRRVLKRLREAGYTRVYTSDGGAARSDHWLQGRSSLGPNDSPESVRRLLEASYYGVDNSIRRLKTAIKRRR